LFSLELLPRDSNDGDSKVVSAPLGLKGQLPQTAFAVQQVKNAPRGSQHKSRDGYGQPFQSRDRQANRGQAYLDRPTVDRLTVDRPTVDMPTVHRPTVDRLTVDRPTVADLPWTGQPWRG
jgi:hypothetical protein